MKVGVPELSLIALVGVSGSGKSVFAARHFQSTEVLSSDRFRALVGDDETDQGVTRDAFDVLHYLAGTRLRLGRLTVVDATNVQREAREPLVELARAHHVIPVAIVLDLPQRLAVERNAGRPDRDVGPLIVSRQHAQLRKTIKGLKREGFRRVYVLTDPEQVEQAEVVRERSWSDRRTEHGPFDIIGDVHGCFDELAALLGKLGYAVGAGGDSAAHPEGRTAVFVGDLVDRGPASPDVLRLVMGMVAEGSAACVPGNHEQKLLRALRGRDVQQSHGLGETLAQLEGEPAEFRERVVEFLDGLVSHYVFDEGRLVVAHAGMRAEMQGRASAAVRAFALYGDTTGETDEFGLPVRHPWARDYRGRALVVYGHTPVPEPEWVNGTVCIDTGCVFGGALTGLRYPERELVSVPAARTYYQPARPLAATEEQRPEDLLDIDDVLGKRRVQTRLIPSMTVREENTRAALEVVSRFAADPRWLVYLPPTMAPAGTSSRPDLLEHPDEAFGYYRREGVERVVCEEKHMGSRAVVVVCRDGGVAPRRFHVDGAGICYTRTGRPFFADAEWERALLERLRAAVTATGLWEELGTDWLVLDCELLPWSAKAEELVKSQYAAVGAASRSGLAASVGALQAGATRDLDVNDLLTRQRQRAEQAGAFVRAYGRYCWPVSRLNDLFLAPFQLLAGQSGAYTDHSQPWHLDTLARLAEADTELLRPTRYVTADPADADSRAAAVRWWEELTAGGGEGMVVKPAGGVTRGRRGLVQPGLKVRGREYLRLIYGPEYTAPENLQRLRERNLGRKRSLATREHALGVEALERFVRQEPLYRVHECVFAVLALESEPVDPRL